MGNGNEIITNIEFEAFKGFVFTFSFHFPIKRERERERKEADLIKLLFVAGSG